MAILADIKPYLRIGTANTAYDNEITDLINAAIADLKLSGVTAESAVDTDPLIKRAIAVYVKANFGWNNPDSEKLQETYKMLKNHLTLSADYSRFEITFTVKDSITAVAIRGAKVIFNGETKYTGVDGKAIFYTLVGTNYEYEVTADDYIADDDDLNWIDVTTTAVAIAINLVAV